MPKKIKECSKAHLLSVALPDHGDSYTVISHESVIDHVYTELAAAGFGIVSEEYRATADGNIAQGIHRLQYNSDPELSMIETLKEINSRKQDPVQKTMWRAEGIKGKWQKWKEQPKDTLYKANYDQAKL